jgi:WD40 repeat protein
LLALVALFATSLYGDDAAKPADDRSGDTLPAKAIARLGSVRFRHPGIITMISMSPDGKEAITACQNDSMLRRCDLTTGQVSNFLDLGTGFRVFPSSQRTSFYFVDGGKRLLAVGTNYVESIDVETKTSLWKKSHTRGGVTGSSAISPDGKWLALLQPGSRGRLLILKSETGDVAHEIAPAGNSTANLAFTHDSAAVTICSHNQREPLRSWSVETGKELPALREIPNGGFALAYSPDGKWLAVGNLQRSLVLFDRQTRTIKQTFGGFTSIVRWIGFTGDGKSVLAFDGTGTTVFGIEQGKELRKFVATPTPTFPVITPEGSSLITCAGNVVEAWRIDTGQPLHPTEGHRSMVNQLTVSPNGELAASVGQDNQLLLWDLKTGEQLGFRQRTRYAPPSVMFTPDGDRVLWASSPTTIEFVDVGLLTQKKPAADPTADLQGNQFGLFAIADDGATIVANNSAGGGIQLWDMSKQPPRLVHLPANIGEQPIPLAFSPDARLSATMFTADRTTQQVLITDLTQRRREVARLVDSNGQQALSGQFAGTRLFATRSSRQIALWDVLSGKTVAKVNTTSAGTTAMTCSPDGRLLVWAESDENRTIHLYDSLNGREVGWFAGHGGFVQCLCLALKGERQVLLSGSQDSTSLVWDLRDIVETLRATTPALADEQPDQLWADLGADDATAMHRASWILTAAGEQAVPLLSQRLEPVPIDHELGDKVAQLVEQMDDDQFASREEATRRAAELGDLAEPFLLEALKTTRSAEARHRVRRLLADIASKPLVVSSDQQRTIRAVQILEQIGGDASLETLRRITAGQPSARLTREAQNALARLERDQKQ